MLAIAGDLKQAVRETGLDASKVRELNKLSATKLNLSEITAQTVRSEAVTEVVVKNLSLSETRELVDELLRKRNSSKSSTIRNTSQRAIKSLQALSVEDWQPEEIEALKQLLKNKLQELEQIPK